MSDAPAKPDAPVQDWRHTVFLPKTDFPMKAGLPQKEPAILARWQEQDLYGQVRKARAGRSPASGKEIKIVAKTIPAFEAGQGFKEAVDKN